MSQNPLTLLCLFTLGISLTMGCGSGTSPEQGSGKVASVDLELESFKSIDVKGIGTIILRKGASNSCTIRTDDNLTDKYGLNVEDGTLMMAPTVPITPKSGLVVTVTYAEQLQKINVDGACSVEIKNYDDFELNITAMGASKLTVDGKVSKLILDASGNVQGTFTDLEADDVEITATGSSGINVYAEDSLTVNASGAVNVRYSGTATVDKTLEGKSRVSEL